MTGVGRNYGRALEVEVILLLPERRALHRNLERHRVAAAVRISETANTETKGEIGSAETNIRIHRSATGSDRFRLGFAVPHCVVERTSVNHPLVISRAIDSERIAPVGGATCSFGFHLHGCGFS